MGIKQLGKLLWDSFKAVLPITLAIFILAFILGMSLDIILNFLLGDLLLVVGLALFTLGSNVSTNVLAEEIGIFIVKKRNLGLFITIAFFVGFLISIAEPAIWVLADQFKTVVTPSMLVFAVAIGIGLMSALSLVRILIQVPLRTLFAISYGLLFLLAMIISIFNPDFIPVAFDSGGVATGALAAPFVMSLGLGISRTRDEKGAKEDSFGLIGMISIGPILAVLILGFFVTPSSPILDTSTTFLQYLVLNLLQMASSILPFFLLYLIFQFTAFRFPKTKVIKILIGFGYTYLGIVLFLTGANGGLVNIGYFMGSTIANLPDSWLLIPLGMLFGYTAIAAEPAVIALNQQIEEVTAGSVSRQLVMVTLAIGTALALGIAGLRVLTGLSIWWFLLPGYSLIIILSFVTPRLFYSIAFDSGGAVSGALTTAFLMPFAQGAATAIGSSGLTDAFGLVALVAMTPIITIEILGLIYQSRTKAKISQVSEVEILHLKEDRP